MKPLFIIFLVAYCCLPAAANHIAGGELTYKYVGRNGTGTFRYEFTLRLFRECTSNGAELNTQSAVIGIYDNASLTAIKYANLRLKGGVRQIAFTPSTIPCLLTNVDVCYQLAEYVDTVELYPSGFGYTAAWQACCRADSIANITEGFNGSTYIAKMPGTAHRVNYNNSAMFVIKDTVVVCAGKPLEIDFGATDADGDELEYEFSGALNASNMMSGSNPPAKLLVTGVTYTPPWRDNSPLGPTVKINPATGLIYGTAPMQPGHYVVNVLVTEARGGIAIAAHNKDFLVKVEDCEIIEATLKPAYSRCNDLTVHFQNETPNPNIQTYLWHFGTAGATSTEEAPEFTYTDTGSYKVKLVVTGVAGCIDSGFTTVNVFPPFVPDFTVHRACQDSLVQFKDSTLNTYGNITSYTWNFGDTSTLADTAHVYNPSYLYGNSAGTRNVKLVVTSSKGCIDSITKQVEVIENPSKSLPFHDTTICNSDTLAVHINTTANVRWSPLYNIINASSNDALFYPRITSTYFVELSTNDCILRDSVRVKVLDFITVDAGRDTAICAGDSIRLHASSEGNEYLWAPATGMDDAQARSPFVSPADTTAYIVTAKLGHCISKDSVVINVAPYAIANAGVDTTVCFGERVALHGEVYGAPYKWENSSSLPNTTSLTTIAYPVDTTHYVLTVFGAPGCPKPVHDTVVINVVPRVHVFAGNDTLILQEQVLQLNGQVPVLSTVQWLPEAGLSDPRIANPRFHLADPSGPFTYKLRATTAEGCVGEDEIRIMVLKKDADIYVPSAFSPNSDGRNDVLKALPVGIKTFNWFRIYNRYGQLLFQTTNSQLGWDGRFNGVQQPTGAYIFAASGIDINGHAVLKKGSFVLLR